MTRDEFCKFHWDYYLALEKDLLETERYISFDLGDDFLYEDHLHCNNGNGKTFSTEFIKQYQAICSEVDVILKNICIELGENSVRKMIDYTDVILQRWTEIVVQKVEFKDVELMPFLNWSREPYKSPDWWSPYNNVKHNRVLYYKEANLKNVVNALAGLYVLENYFVKYLGDRDQTMDVPNDVSRLFCMMNFNTREKVIGRNTYEILGDDIYTLFN